MNVEAWALIAAAVVFLATIARGQIVKSRKKPPVALNWRRSDRGNLTYELPKGGHVTVFKTAEGWKFAAPYPEDVRADFNDEPFFSWPMETAEEAIKAAEKWVTSE